jgi:putative peptidoglycan lipid II flippase
MSRLLRSAGNVSLGTLASRILGLVRDIACAAYFPPYALDAFYIAFTIPNLLRRLFGEGALQSSFIPVFAEVRERDGLEGAAEFTRVTFTFVAVVLVGCFAMLRAASAVSGIWLTSPKAALGLSLLDVMLPFLIFVCLSALFSAVLNSTGSFALPAAGPAVMNAFWIAGVLALGKTMGVKAAALGVLAGGLVQCVVLVPAMARRGVPVGFRWRPSEPALKKMIALSMPVVAGLILIQFNTLIDRLIAETMVPGDGAVTALYFGNRLIQLPLAIFGIAMATAVFPTLAARAAQEDFDGMKSSLRQALRIVFFVAVPSLVGLAVLRNEIVRLLFEYGEFTPGMTKRTGMVIIYYAAGLWAFCGVHLATRALHSLQDMKGPVTIASAMVIVNVVLNLLLVGSMREAGLAFATTIAFSLSFVLLLMKLTFRIGPIGLGEVIVSFGKTCLCAAVMGAGAYAASKFAALHAPGDTVAVRAGTVAGAGMFGLGLFVLSSVLLACPEVKEIWEAFSGKKPGADARE